MTRFGRSGTAAVLFSVIAATPAMARHHIVPGPGEPAESIFCATREPGNPHSKYCDYIEWSKWRSRGGWDSSLDDACFRNPAFIPGECGFNRQGEPLFSAHP